jgi:hypothetical protein
MSLHRGDLVQVIHERSAFYGQVGVIQHDCRCLVAVFSVALAGYPMYSVALEEPRCFPEHHLKKLDGRPAPASEDTTTPADLEHA